MIKLPEMKIYPTAIPEKWDDIEVSAVWEDGEGVAEVTEDPDLISYYSVYLHEVEGGVMCIADCPTEAEALMLADLIGKSAVRYKDNNYLDPIT